VLLTKTELTPVTSVPFLTKPEKFGIFDNIWISFDETASKDINKSFLLLFIIPVLLAYWI
jgi:hypothetical protein